MLQEELPELALQDLSDEEAARAMKSYIKECFSRIPKVPREYARLGSSGDPIPVFMDKVISKTQPMILEIIDRNPGNLFELKFLADMESHLLRHNSGPLLGIGGRRFKAFVFNRLLEKHADNKAAQEPLVTSIMNGYMNQETQWEKLYDASPFPGTKRLAAMHIAAPAFDKIGPACQTSQDQQKFETAYAEFDKRLRLLEKHAGDSEPRWDAISSSYFDQQVKHYQLLLKRKMTTSAIAGAMQPPEIDEARAKKTLDRIQAAVDILKKAKRKN